jgi:hypothetical protein
MHLVFMTRGVKSQRDQFVNFMQTQMFPWKRTNLSTGKDEIVMVQGALRPIELFEYVFPEEHLNEVLTMLNIPPKDPQFNSWGMDSFKRKMLRQALGKDLQDVPEYKPVPTSRFIETRGVAIYPLGIKKDVVTERKDWGYRQEML